MQLYDAIEEMAASRGKSVYAIQKEMGKSNVITSSKHQRKILRSDGLARIADACDYALVLVPADSMPDDAIEIEQDQR